MDTNKPKTINSLMKHLRDDKNMEIAGSSDKLRLRNAGYYHAFKGYRYFRTPSCQLNYQSFREMMAVYDFDSQLKSLFYPHIIFIETALKNRVLEEILSQAGSSDSEVIYQKVLDDYKRFSINGRKFETDRQRMKAESLARSSLRKRMDLRDHMFRLQTNAYKGENRIAVHYLERNESIPIWGIFELMTLGEFGMFVSCMNLKCRVNLSRSLGFRQSDDTDGFLLKNMIYTIKDLRNAIAHNDVIFDTRFKTSKISRTLSKALENEVQTKDIYFSAIIDYMCLVVYLLKHLKCSDRIINRMIKDYENNIDDLKRGVPECIFNKIVSPDSQRKMNALKMYLK